MFQFAYTHTPLILTMQCRNRQDQLVLPYFLRSSLIQEKYIYLPTL